MLGRIFSHVLIYKSPIFALIYPMIHKQWINRRKDTIGSLTHIGHFIFFFHHTTCESTCDNLSTSATNQGDNTVLVAQGSTATPGAAKQLLPPDRVFKRITLSSGKSLTHIGHFINTYKNKCVPSDKMCPWFHDQAVPKMVKSLTLVGKYPVV